MSAPLPPALSPAQWKLNTFTDGGGDRWLHVTQQDIELEHTETLNVRILRGSTEAHALAALCLWQQSFGFSRDDTIALVWGMVALRASAKTLGDSTGEHAKHIAQLDSLASRIASLLPPPDAT